MREEKGLRAGVFFFESKKDAWRPCVVRLSDCQRSSGSSPVIRLNGSV